MGGGPGGADQLRSGAETSVYRAEQGNGRRHRGGIAGAAGAREEARTAAADHAADGPGGALPGVVGKRGGEGPCGVGAVGEGDAGAHDAGDELVESGAADSGGDPVSAGNP